MADRKADRVAGGPEPEPFETAGGLDVPSAYARGMTNLALLCTLPVIAAWVLASEAMGLRPRR